MLSISDFRKNYHQKIDSLDLDLLIAAAIKRPREFVLAHPEYKIPAARNLKLEAFAIRRLQNEPIAYILGWKEFYGLTFKVDKNTLIPRPETEQIVELALNEISNFQFPISNLNIIDIGTGSGNIIISIVKTINKLKIRSSKFKFIGIDISQKALQIARRNAKLHEVDGKIRFLHGNLLIPLIQNSKFPGRAQSSSWTDKIQNYIIVANLPYLSQKIYSKVSSNIKNYEPKSALYSSKAGLAHYEKLLEQIKKIKKNCSLLHVLCFVEISPEQKTTLKKMILTVLPQSHPVFFKDLAGKFRIVRFG